MGEDRWGKKSCLLVLDLPGGAKNSQRNFGLQAASEDVAGFPNSAGK